MENPEGKFTDVVDDDWHTLLGQMNEKGYALMPRFLSSQSCDEIIIQSISQNHHNGKTSFWIRRIQIF
jgi:hypothetical protein